MVAKPTPGSESGEANLINDWEVGFPALPFGRSNVILIGEVVGADAHLSEDKSGIYSEFDLSVEKLLKNESSAPIHPGVCVEAERVGGRVRTPFNQIYQYGISGQGMPKVGRRYVLFLEGDAAGGFRILTGYELAGGRVFPLDGVDPRDGSKLPQFAEYERADETAFLGKIEQALSTPSQQK